MGRPSHIYIKLNFNIKSIWEELWENNLHGTRQHYQFMLGLCSIMFHVKALTFLFVYYKNPIYWWHFGRNTIKKSSFWMWVFMSCNFMGCFEGTTRIFGFILHLSWPPLRVLSPLYDNYKLDMTHVNGVMLQWSPVSNENVC